MNETARKLALLGFTDKQIAAFFEVDERTVNRWKHRYPAFCQSLKQGKMMADAEVAESLYWCAVGHERMQEAALRGVNGQPTATMFKIQVLAGVGAIKFWLNNRQPDKWAG
ncbi:MAG: helix-turn-helix domain-containing protein [Hyphomicrobiales bacterium]|nr:helix-turn-helix domain-containing protein [Hyphomicrobiales bacterium]MCP4999646.1 helix-turn-helix domain-containing protein [Hyphomicrobiales bacterium]